MKKIPLTHGKFALVDDSDFDWLSQWSWCYTSTGYAKRGTTIRNSSGQPKSVQFLMHREIMCTPKGMETDHIDGNKLNNQRANLRIATPSQNKMNRHKIRKHSGQFKGVTWDQTGKNWKARITIRGKEKHIGNFKTRLAAAKAYDAAAISIHGEYATTNKQLRRNKK